MCPTKATALRSRANADHFFRRLVASALMRPLSSGGMPTARRFSAVFFDAGNTLFTEATSRAAIYCAAGRRHGIQIDEDSMREAMGRAHDLLPREIEGAFRYSERWFRVFVETVFAGVGFHGDFDALATDLIAQYRERTTFRVFDDVRPTLKRLKGAGIRLGVISNWSPSLPALLGKLGFESDFEFVLASALTRCEKPDSTIFRRALAASSLPPERCLHIGDRIDNDVLGATAVGIEARLIDRVGLHRDHPQRIADFGAILDLCDLPRL